MSASEVTGLSIRQAGQSPAFTAPNVLLTLESPELARLLSVGQVREAEVQIRNIPGQGSTKGLLIAGVFVPAELPADLKAGDKVEAKVLQNSGQILLQISRQPNRAEEPLVSPEVQKSQILLDLITKLGLEIDDLKRVLRPTEEKTSETPPTLKQFFSTLGQNKAVFEDADFKNPFTLAKKIEVQSKQDSVQILRQTLRQANIQLPEVLPPSSDDQKRMDLNLEKLFQRILSGINSRENPEPTEVLQESMLETSVRKVGQASSAVEHLAQLLRQVGSKTNEKIVEFVRAHLEAFTKGEARAAELLSTSASADPLALLKLTLKQVGNEPKFEATPKDRSFIEFAARFRTELDSKLEAKASEAEIRALLRQALNTIQKEFSQTTSAAVTRESKESTFIPAKDLSPQSLRAVKSIDSQIRTLLSSPEPLVENASKAGTQALKTLLQTLESLNRPPSPYAKPAEIALQTLTKDISEKISKAISSGASDKEVRILLKEALDRLPTANNHLSVAAPIARSAKKIEDLLTQLVHFREPRFDEKQLAHVERLLLGLASTLPVTTEAEGKLPQALRDFQLSMSQAISNSDPAELPQKLLLALKQLFQALGVSEFGPETPSLSLLVKNLRASPEVQKIVDQLEQNLLDLFSQFQEQIPQAGTASNTLVTQKNESSRNFDQLKVLFETLKASLAREETPLMKRQLEALHSLAQLFESVRPETVPQPPRDLLAATLEVFRVAFPVPQAGVFPEAGESPSLHAFTPIQRSLMRQIVENMGSLLEGRSDTKQLPSEVRAQLPTLLSQIEQVFLSPGNNPSLSLQENSLDLVHVALLRNPEVRVALGLLKNLDSSGQLPEGAIETGFLEFVSQLISKGGTTTERVGKDQTNRNQIQKGLERLKEAYQTEKTNRLEVLKQSPEIRALKSIETMLKGQEFFQQMNPLMKAAGEPLFFLFPTILSGLMSQWEMGISLPRVSAPDEDGAKKRNEQGSFTKLQLHLTLPSLGEVHVDLAYRPEELLISLVCENEELSSFIGTRMSRLDKSLRALGVSNVECKVQAGVPQQVTPEWCQELAAGRGVIA